MRTKWAIENPQIPYSMYELNYGFKMLESVNTFNITENDKVVLRFTTGTEYFDSRKPNEIQTTD